MKKIKLSDCPAAVRKTFQAEAKGAKIETVTKEKDEDDETVYWAEVAYRRQNVCDRRARGRHAQPR